MQDMAQKIGAIIIQNTRKRMKELDWNQSVLAEKMRCKQPVISKFLSGKWSPTIEYVERLAYVLRVTPVWLMTQSEIDEPVLTGANS